MKLRSAPSLGLATSNTGHIHFFSRHHLLLADRLSGFQAYTQSGVHDANNRTLAFRAVSFLFCLITSQPPPTRCTRELQSQVPTITLWRLGRPYLSFLIAVNILTVHGPTYRPRFDHNGTDQRTLTARTASVSFLSSHWHRHRHFRPPGLAYTRTGVLSRVTTPTSALWRCRISPFPFPSNVRV